MECPARSFGERHLPLVPAFDSLDDVVEKLAQDAPVDIWARGVCVRGESEVLERFCCLIRDGDLPARASRSLQRRQTLWLSLSVVCELHETLSSFPALVSDCELAVLALFPVITAAPPFLAYLSVELLPCFRRQLDDAFVHPAPRLFILKLDCVFDGGHNIAPSPPNLLATRT